MSNQPDYVMAYDCGTTSLKAGVFDSSGRIIAEANETYPLHQPHPGWAEQDPDVLWEAVCRAGKRVLAASQIDPRAIAAAVFVAPWKNIIPVTADGDVLRRSMIWLDSRAIEQAERLNQNAGFFVGTGQEYWPRLMWLKENEPEVWDRADMIMGLNTYFKWRATGEFVTEPSDDFISSGKEAVQRQFSTILASAGLLQDLAKFPVCRPATEMVGTITGTAATELGLAEGTPVFGGFGDLPAITVGIGRARLGDLHIYLGTSSWLVNIVADRFASEATLHFAFDNSVDGAGFVIQTGCLAYDWAVAQLYHAERQELGGKIADLVNKEVEEIPAGSERLLATHWLNGELPPLAKNATGLFLNLTTSHDRRHMVRAVMESVCYTHRMNLERYLRTTGAERPDAIRVVGGGANSDPWMQMLADILQIRIEVPEAPRYTGVMGAFYCAQVGLGNLEDYAAVSDVVRVQRAFLPNPDHRAVYDRLYSVYLRLLPALGNLYDDLNGRY
ncbi:xylulokinase [Streptomyces rugosispiralis]|uniref:FGGY family carbohydrate kinase n=1 Tax=Streptomyces rugosispiralis TaxID=2967341 RepID=A0ABT1V5M2_9ACTN|nr:FGGY family carbohydrate kinase [Streptomyces rugosispiralis]MCQ8192683.1 FGGY family carbohydrate kinase [Streptomyces rugosispiralis]